jgi:hypothetical protein
LKYRESLMVLPNIEGVGEWLSFKSSWLSNGIFNWKVNNNETGTLTTYIVKKKMPKKVYGPYKYPNVEYSTFNKMINSVHAGTDFWNLHLRKLYHAKA